MKTQEKLNAISDAYISKKVEDEREEIKVINDASPIHDAMRDIQFELNEHTGTFELDYEIMDDACIALSDLSLEEIKKDDFDAYELSHDTASVYTATQLSYINIHNQDEIAEKVKEYSCDIGTAAAGWYEDQVARAIELIRDWLLEVEEN
jgi:hypothetical protein